MSMYACFGLDVVYTDKFQLTQTDPRDVGSGRAILSRQVSKPEVISLEVRNPALSLMGGRHVTLNRAVHTQSWTKSVINRRSHQCGQQIDDGGLSMAHGDGESAVGKSFSQSRVWEKVPERRALIQPARPARQTGYRLCSANVFFLSFNIFLFSGPNSHHVISEPTGPIFTKFSGLIVPWEGIITRSFILRSLKGRCHGYQFFGQICEIAWPHPQIGTLMFQTGLQNRNNNLRGLRAKSSPYPPHLTSSQLTSVHRN